MTDSTGIALYKYRPKAGDTVNTTADAYLSGFVAASGATAISGWFSNTDGMVTVAILYDPLA